MADYKEILYEKQRGGALITLNRPEAMNAISRSMIKEIHQALDDVEHDPRSARCRAHRRRPGVFRRHGSGQRLGAAARSALALRHRHR